MYGLGFKDWGVGFRNRRALGLGMGFRTYGPSSCLQRSPIEFGVERGLIMELPRCHIPLNVI